jgi:hypothetical protein
LFNLLLAVKIKALDILVLGHCGASC